MKKERATIHVAITPQLKERFLKCLEYEGIDQTNFIIAKVYEFVREVEQKMEEQRKGTTGEDL